MGRAPIRAKLVLDAEARSKLEIIAKSRTEGQARIERAKVLLAYHAGERVTAKHGSWLNLVEVFFAKMTRTILRGIRVASKAELKARIMRYLQDLNADPVVFRWRCKPEEASIS